MRSLVANEVERIARSMLGTPWHHQGRLPGVGLDCIGLVVCIAREMDFFDYDEKDYSRNPRSDHLECRLQQFFVCVPYPPAPGFVLLYTHPETKRNHVGVGVEGRGGRPAMIHAESFYGHGQVIEQPIGDKWMRCLKGVFEWVKH